MLRALHLALWTAAAAACASAQCEGAFLHGVASGDPTPDAIILWTRVTPANASDAAAQRVRWLVWPEVGRASVPAASGEVLAQVEHDFTVKVDVREVLQPQVRYAYAFECGALRSPQGSFRLPPAAGDVLDKLDFAIFSCSRWQSGFFTAYRAAAQQSLDLWLHLGDFIYEYPEFQEDAVRTGLQPPHEIISLEDYRKRFAHHRRDADLQSLSKAAPLIAIWDDHELANDVWRHGAQNHQPDTEGNFSDRKAAALQAYHEWMPTRVWIDGPDQASNESGTPQSWRRWRRFDFGTLASLFLLETRHTGRTTQAAMTMQTIRDEMTALFHEEGLPTPDSWNGSRLEARLRELRTRVDAHRRARDKRILGMDQAAWLAEQSAAVAERGATWRLLAQPLVLQDKMSPDYEAAVRAAQRSGQAGEARRWAALLAKLTQLGSTVPSFGGEALPVTPELRDAALRKLAAGRYRIAMELDGWMGYSAGRDRLTHALSQGKPVSNIVYGGDSHNAWVGTVRNATGEAVAAEFDGMGVSSTGLESWVPWVPPDLQAAGWRAANPDLAWAETSRRGFMLVHLNRTAHEVQFLAVNVSDQATSATEMLASFVAEPVGTFCPKVTSLSQGTGRVPPGGSLRRTR
mmetsp:Transcript_12841/g.36484  ORF Transcript_12841/g.36484 Transcript_12841/m.36484 type:complete len:631 (-) Transcript_12841:198-2090(-)